MATKAKTNTSSQAVIEIRPVETDTTVVRIVGTSPLIMHAWDEKAKRMIIDKQMKKNVDTKEKRNPIRDFIESMYWISEKPTEYTMEAFDKAIANGARFGFPSTAIKQAAQSAAYRRGMIDNQMGLRGTFFIHGDDATDSLVEIKYNVPPEPIENMVKIGMGTADVRYRGIFNSWYADLKIEYDKNGAYSLEQIINFLNAGGFCCGIGEWRPEKDGMYGRFQIDVSK